MIRNHILCQSRYSNELTQNQQTSRIIASHPKNLATPSLSPFLNKTQNPSYQSSSLPLRYTKCLRELQNLLTANRQLNQHILTLQRKLLLSHQNSSVPLKETQQMLSQVQDRYYLVTMKNKEYERVIEEMARELNGAIKGVKEMEERMREREEEVLGMRYGYERELEGLRGKVAEKEKEAAGWEERWRKGRKEGKARGMEEDRRVRELENRLERQKQYYERKLTQPKQTSPSKPKSTHSVESIYHKYFPSMAATIKQTQKHSPPSQPHKSPYFRPQLQPFTTPLKPITTPNTLRLESKYEYLNEKYQILLKEKTLNSFKVERYERLIVRLEGEVERMVGEGCGCRGGEENRQRQHAKEKSNRLQQKQNPVEYPPTPLQPQPICLSNHYHHQQQIDKLKSLLQHQQLAHSKALHSLESKLHQKLALMQKLNRRIIELKQEVVLSRGKQHEYKNELQEKSKQVEKLQSELREKEEELRSQQSPSRRRYEQNNQMIFHLEQQINQLQSTFNHHMIAADVNQEGYYDSQKDILRIRRKESVRDLKMEMEILREENRLLARYREMYEEVLGKYNTLVESRGDHDEEEREGFEGREMEYLEKIEMMERTIVELIEQNKEKDREREEEMEFRVNLRRGLDDGFKNGDGFEYEYGGESEQEDGDRDKGRDLEISKEDLSSLRRKIQDIKEREYKRTIN